MSVHIDRQNYEEFYLDYLEGNLSGEVLAVFEAFLKANPDLLVDEGLESILPTQETLDPAIKLAMKQATELSQLSAETLDYFLIAREEGLLTSEQSAQLNNWLQANAQYRNDARLMQLAKLTPSASEIYTAKKDLKRPAGAHYSTAGLDRKCRGSCRNGFLPVIERRYARNSAWTSYRQSQPWSESPGTRRSPTSKRR